MSHRDISHAKSPELRGSMAAMKRAARLARQAAIQSNTALIVMQGDKVVEVPPNQLRREMQEEQP